jgi:hypothetical protein
LQKKDKEIIGAPFSHWSLSQVKESWIGGLFPWFLFAKCDTIILMSLSGELFDFSDTT